MVESFAAEAEMEVLLYLSYLLVPLIGLVHVILMGFNLIVIPVAIVGGLFARARWQVLAAALAAAALTELVILLSGSAYTPTAFIVVLRFLGALGAGCLLGFGIYYIRQWRARHRAVDLL